jgi:hypothetical protein
MKTRISPTTCTLLTVFSFVVLPPIADAQPGILEGTWQMVSQRQVYADTTIDRGTFLGPSYKIINATHFAFGRQTVIDGEPQEDVFAGGGRYTLQGDTLYTEIIEYHSNQGLVGTSLKFKCRVEGDLWYHTGIIGSLRLEEVWQRVH